MTREWVDDAVRAPRFGPDRRDKRWVMRCDVWTFGERCRTEIGPFDKQPELQRFRDGGWSVGALSGDVCSACLAKGFTAAKS